MIKGQLNHRGVLRRATASSIRTVAAPAGIQIQLIEHTNRLGTTAATSITTGVPFGSSAVDRYIIAMFQSYHFDGSVASCKINGTIATTIGLNNTSIPSIAIAKVPAGTSSGTIEVTWNGGVAEQSILVAVFAATGVHATSPVFHSFASDAKTGTVNVAEGGVLLGHVGAYNSGAGIWTGLINVFAYDTSAAAGVGSYGPASAQTARSIGYSTADGFAVMSLNPA